MDPHLNFSLPELEYAGLLLSDGTSALACAAAAGQAEPSMAAEDWVDAQLQSHDWANGHDSPCQSAVQPCNVVDAESQQARPCERLHLASDKRSANREYQKRHRERLKVRRPFPGALSELHQRQKLTKQSGLDYYSLWQTVCDVSSTPSSSLLPDRR